MADFDSKAKYAEALRIYPIESLITHLGFAPSNNKWKGFECPFCHKKKASVFPHDGTSLFKCFSHSCPSECKAMGPPQLLAKFKGLSDRDAWVEYMKLADGGTGKIWTERPTHIRPMAQPAPPAEGDMDKAPAGEAVPLRVTDEIKALPGYGSGYLALREFFSLLTWSEADEKYLFEKRGLGARAWDLRFRSNPETNREIIERLVEKYGLREVIASGLYLPPDRKRDKPARVNDQYCGYGQMGKKPEKQRKHKEDKTLWGKCFPLLIPTFNELGELIALRPHKGGAPAGTAAAHSIHPYIPRGLEAFGDKYEEKFDTVVITEGEFKAAALWQTLGAGRNDGGEPIGVAALPGIMFANNVAIRENLDNWLRDVKCRRVIVAYDREVKDDKERFPARYNPDRDVQHGSIIWARYLALDLHNKLHLYTSVCVLPKEWLQDGKADWDGELARLAKL